jgi:uncharacterized protein YraI
MNAKVTGWKASVVVLAAVLAGCGGLAGEVDIPSEQLVGADEEVGTIDSELSSAVSTGATLKTTTALNLRTGASTGYHILHVIPGGASVTAVRATPVNGWYNIKHNGVTGWSYGAYLKYVSGGSSSSGGSASPAPAPASSSSRDGAISRAKSGVGFSYWWGHARWQPGGPTSSTRGYCSGSCPSCSHSGGNGADCSGYVGKIWQVPSSNSSLTTDQHPYSTINFVGSSSQWHTVSRGSIRRGDAMTYNQNGAGHIFLFESGDGWGSMWAYEAKGCSYGIVHNIRTASSSYKAIARAGY